jgi:tetratricopeptide (TPR) repeat protein
MTEADTQNPIDEPTEPGKGKAFFERAEQVAETGNWDFAIELYIEGLKREPGNVEEGHQRLREVSLKRKAQGGKGPGIGDKFKHRAGKDPATNLVNAAFLLAKEPGSQQFMNQIRQCAVKLELNAVVKWVCDIILESQRQAKKVNIRLLMFLSESYSNIEEFTQAIQACELAYKAAPDNAEIQQALSDLSAQYTMQKGRYGEEGDFSDKVADLDGQKKLMQQDHLVQSEDFLLAEIAKARQEYLGSPDVPGKVNALADALLKIPDEAYEGEAIDVLAKAHRDSGAYQYKLRIGDIKMRQMTRRYRKLVKSGDKEGAKTQIRDQLAFELDEFKERSINYPTDLKLKFELGRRQYLAGAYDDAIASLQQAQRDPRHHLSAMSYLGQAFEAKGWLREAGETYGRALEGEISEDRAKELRYNLGGVMEKMGQLVEAMEQFSAVAQADYNYRDVRERLNAVNQAISNGGEALEAPPQE